MSRDRVNGRIMNLTKIFLIVAGFICLALGVVGSLLPVVPTVPFLLAALICFSKGSKKVHSWFVKTSIYKKYIESYAEDRSMKPVMKFYSIAGTTLSLGIASWYAREIPALLVAIAAAWLALVLYFLFGVKTVKEGDEPAQYKYVKRVLVEGNPDKKRARVLARVFEATGKIKSAVGHIPKVLILRMKEPFEDEKLRSLAEGAGFKLEQISEIPADRT